MDAVWATRTARALPVVALVVFLAWFGLTQDTDRFWITLGVEAMWVATAVVGLNVLLGYTGLISLGHYAFFVLGGFAGAIWAVQDWGLSPWLGFPVAFLFGAATGALLALTCVHLRGFYLTVVTLAFGLISSALALLFDSAFNGRLGRSVEEPLDTNFWFLDASNPNRPFVGLYWVGAGMLLLSLYATRNLVRSRWGRGFQAIRESELAARACGVNTYGYKVAAFAISAGIVAFAGVLSAQTNLQVTMPDGTVIVGQSFQYVIYALVGGAGTLAGPVLGAFTFTLGFGMSLGGESIAERLGEYETMFLAALVIVFMIVAPEGIVGVLVRGLDAARRRVGRPSTPPQYRELPDELVRPRPRRAPDRDPGAAPILELRGVTLRFGGLFALSGVDLAVRPGEIHGLIGPNGSGKSTLVNVVSGLYRADRGTVRFDGRDLTGLAPHRISRLGVARTFQNLQLWRRMTVLEHVMVGAHTRTRVDLVRSLLLPSVIRGEERRVRRRAWGLLHFVGLADRARDPAGTLPYADQRRLEIARALASDPDLLILDEPAAGMNPTEALQLVDLVRQIRDAGVTVLLIEHRMEVVMGLSDAVTVLDFGRRIAEGSPAEVRADPLVIAAYLGEEAAEPIVAPPAEVHEPAAAAGAAPGEPLLSVRDLRVQYGAVRALDGIHLDVYEGEIVALIGSNGAGKSTSLKTVSGVSELLKTVQGEVSFLGRRIERLPAHRIARMGMAHVPEGRRVFPDSTVEENLLLGGFGRREAAVRRDLDGIYGRFPVLAQRRRQPAGLLSGGEQQMLAIGRGLASEPKCLLLDEPSLGLSPLIVEEVFSIVRGLAADGVTVLIVEQMATKALAIADRAYVLETGSIVAEGPADALARDPHVRAAYLGE